MTACPDAAAPLSPFEMGSSAPEIGLGAPEIGSGAPEIGSGAPEIGSSAPEIGSSAPEIGSSAPEIGWSEREIGWSAREIGLGAPEIGSSALEIGSSALEMGSSASEIELDVMELSFGSGGSDPGFRRGFPVRGRGGVVVRSRRLAPVGRATGVRDSAESCRFNPDAVGSLGVLHGNTTSSVGAPFRPNNGRTCHG